MNWITRKQKYPPLSDRQKQALEGFWLGETLEETATRLGVTRSSVNGSRSTAKLKLQCADTLAACKKAVRLGLIKGAVSKVYQRPRATS